MSYESEKIWQSHGLTCEVIMTDMGHRCGYVRIPEGHPFHGIHYGSPAPEQLRGTLKDALVGKRGIIDVFIHSCKDEHDPPDFGILFDVHGGVTFTDEQSEGLGWAIGFDCAHDGDARDLSKISSESRRAAFSRFNEGTIRSLDYVVKECESLAQQIETLAKTMTVEIHDNATSNS